MSSLVAEIEVGVYDAKTHLSELLDQVAEGRVVRITRHGRPAALLTPVGEPTHPGERPFGGWEDYVLTQDWDEFTVADENQWYGA